MDDNVQNCCRICLDVDSQNVSILDDSTIQMHIKSCLPINISTNDNLPTSICKSCVAQLNDFYNFQLNARCSQDWLESSLQEKTKKTIDTKPTYVQPLPDSEYNSDSLLEFLNNTENIEEYLSNLGKEDIPSIVNMLDKTEGTDAFAKTNNCKSIKLISPKKKESSSKAPLPMSMDIDVLDSDLEIVKELLTKKLPKHQMNPKEKFTCFACGINLDTIQKLSHHLSICDVALRTCVHCKTLFDSKQKMKIHCLTHFAITPLTCHCGKLFENKDKLIRHCKKCEIDHIASMGFIYMCKQCGETFNEWFQLYRHAKHHIQKLQERICDICGHKFIGDDALSKHKKEDHENLDTSYRCKVCSFTTPDRSKIYCHVLKHTQAKDSVRHLCESCGCSFANHSTLQYHSRQHNPKSYTCKVCHKGFADNKSKEEHLLEHIEMIICEKCGQSVKKLDKHVCV